MKPPTEAENQAIRASADGATHDGRARLQALVHGHLAGWVRAALQDAAARLAAAPRGGAAGGPASTSRDAAELLNNQRAALADEITAAIEQACQGRVPVPGRPATETAQPLALIAEEQIDEDIEITRIVQETEAACDSALQSLRALASGLLGLPGIDPAAQPLPVLACIAGLRRALARVVPAPPLRRALLRETGRALGRELGRAYVQIIAALEGWGVQPAAYRVTASPCATPRAASSPGHGAPAGARAAPLAAALERLVESARHGLGPAAGAAPGLAEPTPAPAGGDAAGLTLRLFAEPAPLGQAASAGQGRLEPAVAMLLMQRLFEQIEQRLGASPAARQLVAALQEPGRALSVQPSQLWANLDHPWWKLLDRLIAWGEVHDDAADGAALERQLAAVVEQVRRAEVLDESVCRAAADQVQALATGFLDATPGAPSGTGPDDLARLQSQADCDEIENDLRAQMVLQLRGTPVAPGLRRFLLGPWTQAMAQAALQQGLHGPTLARMASLVDDLIQATARPGERAPAELRARLQREAAIGLGWAGLGKVRQATELAELQQLLHEPPPLPASGLHATDAATEPDAQEPPAMVDEPAAIAHAAAGDIQGGLPTVPMAMDAVDTTLELAGQRPWLECLAPGICCRLFLQGQWLTAQLAWTSPNHNLFLFKSRHGGRTHSLTRRMLVKLRAAGLATHIEDGALIAQAMAQLADTGLMPG